MSEAESFQESNSSYHPSWEICHQGSKKDRSSRNLLLLLQQYGFSMIFLQPSKLVGAGSSLNLERVYKGSTSMNDTSISFSLETYFRSYDESIV